MIVSHGSKGYSLVYSKDSHRDVFQKLMPHTAAYKDSVMAICYPLRRWHHAAVIFGINLNKMLTNRSGAKEVIHGVDLQKNEK